MGKPVARFMIAYGLNGCYLPDSDAGAYEVTTRKALVAAVRDALELYDMPASSIRQVKWRRVWAWVKRSGHSSLHYSISHKGFALSIMGLTEEEYQAQTADDCR